MEFIIILLLIYLIFKDEIREEIRFHKDKKAPVEKTKKEIEIEKRKEELEAELRNMMDYSIDTAVNSKKR